MSPSRRFLPMHAVGIGLGVSGLLMSWLLNSVSVVSGQLQIGLMGAIAGALAGFWLIGVVIYQVVTRRGFLTLNPFAILASYVSGVVVFCVGAAYIGLMIVIELLKSISF